MSKQKHDSLSSEASKETRARIIAAAYNVLAEKGYEATTLREISKAADAAPGLVHYYFGGKDQLLVEVLKAVNERYRQLSAQFTQPSERDDVLSLILQEPIDRIIEEPQWYRLRQELFALGLHNALIEPKVRELLASDRESIALAIESILGETTVEPALLATLLLAFFDGLALQKIMDPALDVNACVRVLAKILHAFEREDS